MSNKLKLLQNYLIAEAIDVIYLDDPTTVAYFTGFESNPHERIVAFIVSQKEAFLFVPTLEVEEAKKRSSVQAIYSYNDSENPWEIITREINNRVDEVKQFAIDEETLSVARYFALQEHLETTKAQDIGPFVDQMRVVKTTEEIKKMKKAGALADHALKVGIEALTEGITEQEIVAIIETEMKKQGVSEMSFPTLILFGDHAASPHGVSGDRKLKQGELVLLDLGVIYEGYASDVTRTIAFGATDARQEEIYQVVLEANQTAQAAVKPGMRAGELDKIAREIIEKAGYGEYFTHRLGHGIGKTAHEFPSIHGANETILEPGMCFSIEPGIYIPGEIGVRIEDCVYVTEEGSESFTHTNKELTTIIE